WHGENQHRDQCKREPHSGEIRRQRRPGHVANPDTILVTSRNRGVPPSKGGPKRSAVSPVNGAQKPCLRGPFTGLFAERVGPWFTAGRHSPQPLPTAAARVAADT